MVEATEHLRIISLGSFSLFLVGESTYGKSAVNELTSWWPCAWPCAECPVASYSQSMSSVEPSSKAHPSGLIIAYNYRVHKPKSHLTNQVPQGIITKSGVIDHHKLTNKFTTAVL